MALKKSIKKYWSIGICPTEDCLLQTTRSELTRIRDQLVHRCHLSDGYNISSLFHYQQQMNDNYKPLPTQLSVIRIKNISFKRYLTVWFIFFDDFDVVAESSGGRIELIGNPVYLESDPRVWKPWYGTRHRR